MDFRLTPAQLDIRNAAREFPEGEFPNIAKECDLEETFNLELLKRLLSWDLWEFPDTSKNARSDFHIFTWDA